MPLYYRILGLNDPDISLEELQNKMQVNGFSLNFEILEGRDNSKWQELQISSQDGLKLIYLERDPVIKGELGKEELEEMKRDVQDFKPKSAVKWLNKYLEKIKVIYAFEFQDGLFHGNHYLAFEQLKIIIHEFTGGIFQADDEGFYNENGDLILWQFASDTNGEWDVALLDGRGMWDRFTIDLGNRIQREAFQEGKKYLL